MRIAALLFVFLILISGCVDAPFDDDALGVDTSAPLVFIVNEGLLGSNKAEITKITANGITNNFISKANSKFKLGDIATDIVIKDSVMFIVVSGSGYILACNMYSGAVLGKYFFPKDYMPRYIAVINDSIACVTAYVELSLSEHNVFSFNMRNYTANDTLTPACYVGSHPEGVCYVDGYLYVVNSGYGDLDRYGAGASTISIIDAQNMNIVANIKTGSNPNKIITDGNAIYVACWGYPSENDTSQAEIIAYSLYPNITSTARWNTLAFNMTLHNDTLFYINGGMGAEALQNSGGVNFISLNSANSKAIRYITNPSPKNVWTNLAIDADGEVWVSNAFDYQRAGEVIVYDAARNIKKQYSVGNIPNKILFVKPF